MRNVRIGVGELSGGGVEWRRRRRRIKWEEESGIMDIARSTGNDARKRGPEAHTQSDGAIRTQENVASFQVTMDDPLLMKECQCLWRGRVPRVWEEEGRGLHYT